MFAVSLSFPLCFVCFVLSDFIWSVLRHLLLLGISQKWLCFHPYVQTQWEYVSVSLDMKLCHWCVIHFSSGTQQIKSAVTDLSFSVLSVCLLCISLLLRSQQRQHFCVSSPDLTKARPRWVSSVQNEHTSHPLVLHRCCVSPQFIGSSSPQLGSARESKIVLKYDFLTCVKNLLSFSSAGALWRVYSWLINLFLTIWGSRLGKSLLVAPFISFITISLLTLLSEVAPGPVFDCMNWVC